jgi:peptidoglycan hydrolase-like protein with peptidoglycan-binding domain
MANLKVGSSGSQVRQLQQMLNSKNFNVGDADGKFGPKTLKALERFQLSKGLQKDGVAGPATLGALGISGFDRRSPTPTGGTPAPAAASGTSRTVRAGKGWGGSEGVADTAKAVARQQGVGISSEKRNLADTRRVGSSTHSDHFTGNKNAFATDFPVRGARGDKLARDIAKAYGIPASKIGTFGSTTIKVGDKKYSVQLLWKVKGHFDHVHVGIHRV